jgi:hypothetical protein
VHGYSVGRFNTAIGFQSLRANTTGDSNTALGYNSLKNNISGKSNTVMGFNALMYKSTGDGNVVIGDNAGKLDLYSNPLTNLTNSVILGRNTTPDSCCATNQIVIGANAISLGGNTTVIGNSSTTRACIWGNLNVSNLTLSQAAFINQNTASLASGTQTISTNTTGSYTTAFYQYTLASGSNARSGQVMTVWNGASIRFTDITTTDIGTTAAVALTASLSGANVVLSSTLPTSGWTIKTLVNLI